METQTQTLSLHTRYLIALVGEQKLAFPADWVRDILVIERSQRLNLPFYNPIILGVSHHQNQIVPLVSAREILGEARIRQQNLTAVRLSDATGELSKVGVVVDRIVGSLSETELDQERQFQISDIPSHVWQPQRWRLGVQQEK